MQYYITQEGLDFLEEEKLRRASDAKLSSKVKRGLATAGVIGAIGLGVKHSVPEKNKPIASAETRGGVLPSSWGEPVRRGPRAVPPSPGSRPAHFTRNLKPGEHAEDFPKYRATAAGTTITGKKPEAGARRVPGDAGRATTATTKGQKRGRGPKTGPPVSDT